MHPRALLAIVPLVCGACAASQPVVAGPGPLPETTVEPVVIRGYTRDELLAQFERARSFLLVDQFAEAARAFDDLAELALDPELAGAALYNAGLAFDGLGDQEQAVGRYGRLAQEHPAAPETRLGLVRLGRLLARLERWSDLQSAADALLGRADLAELDRVEGHGQRALALVEQGQAETAQGALGKALEIIDRFRFGDAGAPPVQLAPVYFALGEVRRVHSEEVKLVPVTPSFPETLERRCQGLLEAQSAYTDAMRARDAYWSAMSGYRVGQLYQQLHREALQIPAPDSARTTTQKQLFEAAMRLRYRKLLEKGLKMMDAVLDLGERTGDGAHWVARARQAKNELERSMEEEKAALARMPFTEDEVRAGLDKLKAQVQAKP